MKLSLSTLGQLGPFAAAPESVARAGALGLGGDLA